MTKHKTERVMQSRSTESQQNGEALQKKIFRSMSAAQKLDLALQLYYSARELKEAGLRAQNPDWSEELIQRKLRNIFMYAQT